MVISSPTVHLIPLKYNPHNVIQIPKFSCFPNRKLRRRTIIAWPNSLITMAEGNSSNEQNLSPVIVQERIMIQKKDGEKLVGLLEDTGSKDLVILCHGFRSSKETGTLVNLATTLTSNGIGAFRFDFSGNGESGGEFLYGNYWGEVEDLRAVVLHFSGKERNINTIIGHSKEAESMNDFGGFFLRTTETKFSICCNIGGNAVLLYASKHHDIVQTVINISGRYDLTKGIEDRLGKDFEHRINEDGFIDVADNHGNVNYRVTKESLMDRLQTDMKSAALSIPKSCRVLTIHGSKDEIIPITDAFEFDKLIPNHSLHVIDEANHNYSFHQNDLASVVLNFIKAV